jgi:2-phospho-L-lactate transferase/gluconeogenesis factor (CofD/UPF0052 family)
MSASSYAVTVEVASTVDTITLDYASVVNFISVNQVSIDPDTIAISQISDVDTIVIDYSNAITSIVLEEVSPAVRSIEIMPGAGLSPVNYVNNLIGNVVLTYTALLTYVNQSNGVYTYPINHNLHYDYPIVMVYNSSNELVDVSILTVDEDNLNLQSTSNMNGYRVVVQR